MDNLSQSLSIPVELLGLNDIKIEEIKINKEDEIIIRVQSTKTEIQCHQCGKDAKYYGKGRTLKLRHLPILGKRTFIEITPPRGICESCDNHPTTTQTLSWFERNGHYTKSYEQHVLLSMVNSTLADVGIKERLSENAVQMIIDKFVNEKINWKAIKKIGVLGIDEISLKKGYKDFITIITSRMDNRIKILAVIKGREKAEIKAFFARIPKKKRKTMIAICCDMYDGYINAAKEILGETIAVVIDRFHLAQLYRKSLIGLRKKELVRLRKELTDEEYKTLKPAIAILVKHQECISKEEKKELQKLFKYSPLLKVAYRLAREMTIIFNTHHKKVTAIKKIDQWIEKAQISEVSCFDSFIKTLIKYKNEVSNYFIARNSSGFVEGLNNKIKVIKRRCYGIFNLKHLFQRLFLDLEGYEIFNIYQPITVNV